MEDVVVEVEQGEDGAVIRVLVQPVSRIEAVEVLGLPRAEAKRVRAVLGLVKGAPFWTQSFEAALDRARQDLVGEGYPESRLTPDLRFDQPSGQVVVTVHGELGRPLTARTLEAPGSGLGAGELWEICKLQPGRRLTSAALERARRGLASYLRQNGYWEAEAQSPAVVESQGGASVTLGVRVGPRYELELEGLKLTRSLKAEALPFLRGEESFNEAAVESVVERVRVFLQHEGRLLATVQGEVIEKGNTRVLKLKVTEGPRTPIQAVRFPGLHSVPERDLHQKVGARPGRFWRWGGELVDDETLDADASSVLATLRAAGFAEATVGAPRVVPSGEGVVIEFPVDEGARSLVQNVTIRGVPAVVKVPALPIVRDGPWSQGAEEQARATLETAIRDAGYPDARVTVSHTCEAHSCSVTFTADPGTYAVVGRIVVAGLARTSPRVVEQVAALKQGQVAGPDAQLAAQRRLLSLGVFQTANIRPIPDQDSGDTRGLVIDLSEGPTGAYAVGLGYDTEQKTQV
ncbi:MAG: POTRA domain-containing protein, partial [Myxococcaceae bacterium]